MSAEYTPEEEAAYRQIVSDFFVESLRACTLPPPENLAAWAAARAAAEMGLFQLRQRAAMRRYDEAHPGRPEPVTVEVRNFREALRVLKPNVRVTWPAGDERR